MKKNLPLRWIVTLFIVGLAGYFLFYSVRYYTADKEARQNLVESVPNFYNKIVNLGLDLQGGMRLVLEIDRSQLSEDEKKDVLDRTHTVISNRVNGLGVAEPVVQKQGNNRLIIELPGLQNAERAKKILGNTAMLEFKLVRDAADLQKALEIIDNALSGKKTKATKDSTVETNSKKSEEERVAESIFKDKSSESASSKDTSETAGIQTEHPFTSLLVPIGSDIGAEERYKEKINHMLGDTVVHEALRRASMNGSVFLWANEAQTHGNKKYRLLYYLKKKAEITGAVIANAMPNISSGGLQAGKAVVNLKLKSIGARKFGRITGRNIDKRLAIVLDNTVYSAPVIKAKITTGSAQISGMKNMEEARDLSIVLRAGALPAPAKIVEERTVGPTLGKRSIRASLLAAIISFIVIIVFMALYYGLMGLIADIALVLNMLLLFGFMAATNSTLTLPGVAGLILILGIAVDANVLINERIREELKAGKTVRSAIAAGYSRALAVIFDANLTTVVTGVILFKYGTGPIKGFALTLSSGVIINMFTALFITRLIVETYSHNKEMKSLSIGKIAVFRNAAYSFISLRKHTTIVSGILIIASFLSIAMHKGLNLGIDFKGGNLLLLKFEKNANGEIEKIRKGIDKVVSGTPEIKPVGKTEENTIQIMVQNQPGKSEVGHQIKEKLHEILPGNSFDLLKEEKVGPRIGKELKWRAILAISLSIIFMILYLAWRFKQISYGVGAVVALLHDVIIGIGMLSITGREFSLPIVAALLTIVGYSVNDTIVIFDRVRENIRLRRGKEPLERIFDLSINQNLSRTVLTSLTTFFVVIVLFLFGGRSINDFVFVILVGIISGTYSSIYVASPVVLSWQKKQHKENKRK